MTLTAGTTLQNQKYVIQKQLHQSEVGITYQAQHAYLDQPVLLQSLNEALRQHSNFAQLKQQFLHKVRTIAQQPQSNLRVLDCFEEGEMPFVVFELSSRQAEPPEFPDWLPVLEAANLTPNGLEISSSNSLVSNSSASNSLAGNSLASNSLVDQGTAPAAIQPREQSSERLPAGVLAAEVDEVGIANSPNPFAADQLNGLAAPESVDSKPRSARPDALPISHNGSESQNSLSQPDPNPARPAESSALSTSTLSTAGLTNGSIQATLPVAPLAPAVKPVRRPGLMPLALLFTSLLAGLLGAGFGYLLRFSAPVETGTPRLAPRLFSREQPFPAEADWPITETPQTFSDPLPIEDPIYRSTPTLPDYEPLPSASFQPVPTPLPIEPPATNLTPPSPAPAAPAAPAPVEPAPPQISDAPAPAAIEPAPPAPPPPPPSSLPAPPIALPQPAPPELSREPQVLKN